MPYQASLLKPRSFALSQHDPAGRPASDVIARLEHLERRTELLWRTVDVLVDQALDAATMGLTVEQLREARAAAVAAAVEVADRCRTESVRGRS